VLRPLLLPTGRDLMRGGRLCTGLYCAEGEPRPAKGALAIQKAMPTGGRFNESFGIRRASGQRIT
jgi:hypothetical protein